MKIYKVNSSQFNFKYGDQIHFPYSIGRLIAYIKSKKTLNSSFKFEKTFVFRDKIDEYIKQCKNSDILLCSCYVWNWEITKYLAKQVKQPNPNCLIIFGGPQVPDRTEGFFENHPFIDIIVHGEGEYVLENILNAFLKDKNFTEIKGIETRSFRNSLQPRITDLASLPSPYLTNIIWELVEKVERVKYIAAWETNRGCPYQCTFCDWGSLTNSKMSKWSEEILFKETEWFAENKIPYIDCCDANFGIYQERDLRIATKLKEEALKSGYPHRFRVAWAKFSSEKIIPIAKELQQGGILKGVSLSLQSLDENTLKIIKRENIKFNKFSELTQIFRQHGIPTYTELIMGLPGETVESWKKGLEVLAATKPGSIYIYNCGVYPNAPMNEPAYVKFYDIKKIHSPIYLAHTSIRDRGIPEYEEIIVSTSSFSTNDLKMIYLYSWLIQTFFSLGIFEYITKYYYKQFELSYMKFYDIFLNFCQEHDTMFSEECKIVADYINKGYSGEGWNHYEPNLGDIYWAIEEASWLRFVSNKESLIEKTMKFLKYLEKKIEVNTPDEILIDLIKFQIFLLTTYEPNMNIKLEKFNFDWKNYFVNDSSLQAKKKNYHYKNLVLENDKILWCFKTVFWGRQPNKYKFHPENLIEEKDILVQN